MKKVFLTGGDGVAWALDEDLRQFQQVLDGRVKFCSFAKAEILHCVWWERLLEYSREQLASRYVVCHLDNPPFVYLKNPSFHLILPYVNCWVARSREALEQVRRLKLPGCYVPYTVDLDIFNNHPEIEKVAKFREQWEIPQDRYVIANFYRDTDVSDLKRPKFQKGPDAVIEIAKILMLRGIGFHFLLAGPRRFYIRRKFEEFGIPFSYAGEEDVVGDDLGINSMNRADLATLYKCSDLYLSMSRWEGGPQSVLEASATGCPMLCNRVGIAMDVLSPESLFSTPGEAAALIEKEVASSFLKDTTQEQMRKVEENHDLRALEARVVELINDGVLYETSLPRPPFHFPTEKVKRFAFRPTKKLQRKARLAYVGRGGHSLSLNWPEDEGVPWVFHWLCAIADFSEAKSFTYNSLEVLPLTTGEGASFTSNSDSRRIQIFSGEQTPSGYSQSDLGKICRFHLEHCHGGLFGTSDLLAKWIDAGLSPQRPLVLGDWVAEKKPLDGHSPDREPAPVLELGFRPERFPSLGKEPPKLDISLQEAEQITEGAALCVAYPGSPKVVGWIHLCLAHGIPVLFHAELCLGENVEFGGCSFANPEELQRLHREFVEYPQAMKNLIRVPDRDSLKDKLKQWLERLS